MVIHSLVQHDGSHETGEAAVERGTEDARWTVGWEKAARDKKGEAMGHAR